MIVYSTYDGLDAPRYYATKKEAVDDAISTSKEHEDMDVDVQRLTLVKMDRFAILNMLNQQGGYVDAAKPIGTWRNGKLARIKTGDE